MDDIDIIIEKAVKILQQGGLVAFPTDTVYCLGADPFNPQAIARLYEVKQRPLNIALPVICANMQQLLRLCKVSPLGLFMANEFFPAGFTLVMYKSRELPALVTAGKNTVAVRIQDNPIATAIAEKLGRGVIGTSANIHNMKSPVSDAETREQLDDRVDLIIEGKCTGGIESTIVDVTNDHPVILRQGAISTARVTEAWERFKTQDLKERGC